MTNDGLVDARKALITIGQYCLDFHVSETFSEHLREIAPQVMQLLKDVEETPAWALMNGDEEQSRAAWDKIHRKDHDAE